jgi:DNA-binding PadR family transcriptional regulator
MFRDHSLIPTEAIRLAALGLLAEAPRRYGELAAEVRHFTGRIAGPSLDLIGTPLELLRLEGLVAAADAGSEENALLEITPAGRAALEALLGARLRAPLGDYTRLVLLLKLRFLHHLPAAERRVQMALIAESLEGELARLRDLRRHDSDAAPRPFLDWLDSDIAALEARLAALQAATATEGAAE